MNTIPRKDLKAWATKHLLEKQGGACSICGLPVDYKSRTDMVVDHDHNTGEIRGVLHRTCNTGEGKVRNLVTRWGARTSDLQAAIRWLEGLVRYYRQAGAGVMYPGATTPEQRAEATRLKRNKAAAARRAKAKLEGLK